MDANILLTQPKISVITATFNAASCLPALIESLQNQTDKDFEWIIADGGSTDETLALLEGINDLNIKITSQPDFGIYDALNRGIKVSSGDYYITAGADDLFYNTAIASFREAVLDKPNADIISANTQIGDILVKPKGEVWLYGMKACIAAHSIGTLISKKLHQQIGFYSRSYPIAADELFILTAAKHKCIFHYIDTVTGFHSVTGVSSTNVIGSLLESFRVKLQVGENKYLQLPLLFIKLLKNIRKY